MESLKPKISVPHFSGTLKKARHSNNSFEKASLDIIDNIILKALNILISLTFDENKLYKIVFSDDYEHGFENIEKQGAENPFNLAHQRDGHRDDNETSEFGMGFKFAAMFIGNELIVYTKVSNSFYRIEFAFLEMNRRCNPIESYEPTKWEVITETEYNANHPYKTGSSVIIKGIRNECCTNVKENIISNIKEWISDAYYKIMNKTNVNISLSYEKVKNDKIIPIADPFDDPLCKPFIMKSKIFIHKTSNLIIVKIRTYYNSDLYFKYSVNEKQTERLVKYSVEDFRLHNLSNFHTMEFISVFTKFNEEYPMYRGYIHIFRMDRKYAVTSYKKHRNNGGQNYTIHHLEYKSKDLNRKIGMNYNKGINDNYHTDLTECLYEIQHRHEKYYSADTSSNTYKKLYKLAIQNNIVREPTPPPKPVPKPKPSSVIPAPAPAPTPAPAPEIPASAPEIPALAQTPAPIIPEPKCEVFVPKQFAYLAIKKKNRYDMEIPLENGKIRGKIGYTTQAPSKRITGSILKDGYEIQHFDEINDNALNSEFNKFRQNKTTIENELYKKLCEIDSVDFIQNSTEIFLYDPNVRYNIRDIFLDTTKLYRF